MNVLIIGGNRGLGLEWTRQWLDRGATVYSTARQPGKADELQELQNQHTDKLHIHKVDVASDESVERLAKQLQDVSIDVLIQNAGISGRAGISNLDGDDVLHTINVNSVGALRVVQAFLPNLKESSGRAKIVLTTSLMGSIDDNRSGGSYAYRMSKAALNMAGKSMAVDLADDGIDVLIVHPGWVQTDMGGSAARITVDDSINGMMKLVEKLGPEMSGTFWHTNGKQLEW